MAPVLVATDLSKSVGAGRAARRLLNGVSLSVDADEVVAVLGRSGSGKSTLLHLLGGLDSPDSGTVEVAGERLAGRGVRRLPLMRLRHIGFVFQQFQLIEELSGYENVLLPTRLPGAPPGGARRAAALVEELGLRGGRLAPAARAVRRRAAAVRASPARWSTIPSSCWPTSRPGASTPISGAAVLELLRGLRGRAVVIVTHEPDAAAIADRVLALGDGRLAPAVAT